MSAYSPHENAHRVREGLLALVKGNPAAFDDTATPLIVTFDVEPSIFAAGRIMHFQRYFLDRLGFYPQVVRQEPACVKVFFAVPEDALDLKRLREVLYADEFRALCDDLRVTRVQFQGAFVLPRPSRA